jgi:hypothetical protein
MLDSKYSDRIKLLNAEEEELHRNKNDDDDDEEEEANDEDDDEDVIYNADERANCNGGVKIELKTASQDGLNKVKKPTTTTSPNNINNNRSARRRRSQDARARNNNINLVKSNDKEETYVLKVYKFFLLNLSFFLYVSCRRHHKIDPLCFVSMIHSSVFIYISQKIGSLVLLDHQLKAILC